MEAKLVSSRFHRFVLELKMNKNEEKKKIVERESTFYVKEQMATWTVHFFVSPTRAKISFSTIPSRVLRETHRIVCSILNDSDYGVITFCGYQTILYNEIAFFDWYDIVKIYKKSGVLHICFDIIDISLRDIASVTCDMVTNLQMLPFFESGEFSNISIVTETKEFKAHKIVLASRSSVFAAMLRNDMQEANTGKIFIKNVKSDVVEELLRYMYSNVSLKLPEMPCELYTVSHMYDIQDLERLCIEHLLKHMSVHNFIEILMLCDVYSLENLRKEVAKFIENNEESAVQRNEYIVYLKENMTAKHVTYSLTLSYKYNLADFKQFVMDFIVKNYTEVLQNDNYRQMCRASKMTNLILEVNEHVAKYIAQLHTKYGID